MPHKLIGARLFDAGLQTTLGIAIVASIAAISVFSTRAQELIYQEGFNNDGEAATPKRYTTVGRDIYEIPRLRDELMNTDQLGPVYWAHNFEVSFAGVPAPTPARRMIMVWDTTIDASTASEDVLKLWESAVKWLVNNKANAKIVVSGGVAAIGVLGDRLTAAGYTLVDDDTTVVEEQVDTQGDLLIHALAGSRGANAKIPLISMLSSDLDDLLLGTIGTAATFEAEQATIVTPTHPAAGGKTGSFPVATGSFNWQLTGDQLPANAIVLANFIRPITPTIASLADLDAMIAGTKPSTKTTGTVGALDFSDASAGNWTDDNTVPGGATGNWGILATGKLTVSAAGTYSFALGTDDGGRVQIDINKNGFDAADTIIENLGPTGAHALAFGNAIFAAPDTYDFRVLGYNSSGGGDLEVSVATSAGAGKTNLVDSPGDWEALGTTGAASPVKVQGTIDVTAYVATGDVENVSVPLMVLLNGPNDTPPGTVYGGGPFTGFEGTGFFAGSGLNKWPYPDASPDHRSLTLAPVNVAGKTNVKITVALAATFLDFETTDYLDLVAFPNGASGSEVVLAHYAPPDGNTKYFVDITHANAHRLNLAFQDVTYDIPAGATDLVIEFRAATTWWNEIVAFDNVRITSGAVGPPPASGQPAELGQTVNGFQDDFTGATRDPNWVPVGAGGDFYQQANGLLSVSVRTNDPNHLLYEAPGYSNTVQEVLARIRVTAFAPAPGTPPNTDASRAGIGVGVGTNSQGINLHFRDNDQDGVPGRQFKLLDDARAWGPPGLRTNVPGQTTPGWTNNVWYWMRLRQEPNANSGTNDVFAKVWLADAVTPEPADWQLTWNYIPARTVRTGFAGITGSSINGVGNFDVDYILIKAEGLPQINVNFSPLAPQTPVGGGPTISIARSANDAVITFTGTLEAADAVNGPYAAVAGATSPSTVPLSSGAAKFYRSKQ